MNIKNTPLNKDEFKSVLLRGFVSMLLISIFMGIINAIIVKTIGASLIIYMIFIGLFIGYQINVAYNEYNKIYSIVAIIFTVIGYYISNIVLLIFIFENFDFNLFTIFKQILPFYKSFYNVSSIIHFISFGISIFLSYYFSKRRSWFYAIYWWYICKRGFGFKR